jgi:hypothetical protein
MTVGLTVIGILGPPTRGVALEQRKEWPRH